MEAIGAIFVILIIYLLYQLVMFLFNSGLLLIAAIILILVFFIVVFLPGNIDEKKKKINEKLKDETIRNLEDKWNPKVEEWKLKNKDFLEIQETYEKMGYMKIDMGHQSNELASRYKTIKKKQENKKITQTEKEILNIEASFLRKLGEMVIQDSFWRSSHQIFYIFIENSILKIREKIVLGSNFKNEKIDIKIENIFYYQETGEVEERNRTMGYVRQSKSPGVIGSAVVGGLIAGSTGAVVGAMSGMNNTNRNTSQNYVTEYYDKRSINLFYKDEDGKNKIYEFKNIRKFEKCWKILVDLIPEKSYEEVALQNGDFHLVNKKNS